MRPILPWRHIWVLLPALLMAGCDGCGNDEYVQVVQAQPAIALTSTSPGTAAYVGGDAVSLDGELFDACGAGVGSNVFVRVGRCVVPATITSATEISFTAPPAEAAGSTDISLLCPEGVFELPGGLTYAPPVPSLALDRIAGCFDNERPAGDEGTTVTATVTDLPVALDGTATVTVGGAPANNVVVVDATTLAFDVPDGLTAGTAVDVVVTQGGTSATGTGLLTVCGPINASTLLLNEFFVHPESTVDANRDGGADSIADEFVELVNAGTAPIDLGGYILTDVDDPIRHRFPPGTIVPAGGVLVVFGGGMATGFAPGTAQQATLGTLGLKNSAAGDNVIVRTPDGGTEILNYHYRGSGDVGGREWVAQVSLQNVNEGDLSQAPVYDQHNVFMPGTDVSPGTRADGSAFP